MFAVFAAGLVFVPLVHAALYVVKPTAGSICHGGEKCTVEWLDDGESPLLSAMGIVTVGLFTGNQHLIQSLTPVDVSRSISLTFTPNSKAGPSSDTYYIAFTSTELAVNGSAFSPFFRLDRMSGSFTSSSPLSSATSSISIPPSLTHTSSGSIATTITVGNLSTSSTSRSTPLSPSQSSSVSQSTASSQSTNAAVHLSASVTIAVYTLLLSLFL